MSSLDNSINIISDIDNASHAAVQRIENSSVVMPAIDIQTTRVRGVTLHNLRQVVDMRGSLSVAELGHDVPFIPLRYFLIYDVPSTEGRGEHAHLQCAQFLVAIKGSLHVIADDGHCREEFVLNKPSQGLLLPSMTWGIQYNYSPDAVLLVLASDHYDPNDYIRNYDNFLKMRII